MVSYHTKNLNSKYKNKQQFFWAHIFHPFDPTDTILC